MIFFAVFIILSTSMVITQAKNIENASFEKDKVIYSKVVGEINISLSTQGGDDNLEWNNWYKQREFSLYWGNEELCVALPWQYDADYLNSQHDYDLYLSLEVNGESTDAWIQISNGVVDSDLISINIDRKRITYINYKACTEIHKDGVKLDNDEFSGYIIILSTKARTQPRTFFNSPFLKMVSPLIEILL